MRVPIHVVSGFLGAGKTTAIRHLLANADERVAVLVNDFGEASLDAESLGEGAVRIEEIPGGCVCCTAPEGFVAALGALLDEARPDRIVVEPTGLARPADLIDTIRRSAHADRLAIGPLVVLVDPMGLGDVPLMREQAEAADVLVASKTEIADPVSLVQFDAFAESLWPGPMRVLHIARGELPADALQWPEGEGPRRPRFQPLPAADLLTGRRSTEGYAARSLVWGPDEVFHRDRLTDAIAKAIPAGLVRLKGMFRTEEGVWRLEVAPGRVDERPSSYRRDSRVDLIVQGADLDALEADLRAAVLTEAERRVDAQRIELVLPDGTRRVADRGTLQALPGVDDISQLMPKRQGAAASLWAWLEQAGIAPHWTAVAVAADGYATPPVPVDALRTALLLHSIDGACVPADQGGPFRLLIPGDAGPGGPCANVKGVVRIALREPAG